MTTPWHLAVHKVGCALVCAIVFLTGCDSHRTPANSISDQTASSRDADVIVVGAGIAGLSAALEAARGGASVLVVDKWSIFGGHAVMSMGALNIVGTPTQVAQGIQDSPELAQEDFLTWGIDANPGWVAYYARHSRTELYDWLTGMGIEFTRVAPSPGNSVPRIHILAGRGLGLVSPIYRNALLNPNIRFAWNVNIDRLMTDGGRVIGVEGQNVRTGERTSYEGQFVILATGGFQSNLALVKENWRADLQLPDTILTGSGINSQGSGLKLARDVGAALRKLDHQWNYVTGLPDPRHEGEHRGLSAWNFRSIWVNADGHRFTNELASPAVNFPALLAQHPAQYWQIFDEPGKGGFAVSGSDWADSAVVDSVILSNQKLVKSAMTLEDLANEIGLPTAALRESVTRYNQLVKQGADSDFGRFDHDDSAPPVIGTPPYYAATFYPLTRKSMGGIAIDLAGRVVDEDDNPVPGLLAAGEATGFGGINGSAALEGTFLGPSIIIGRVAARTVLGELSKTRALEDALEIAGPSAYEQRGDQVTATCLTCHDLASLIAAPRKGYLHFEAAHRVVVERRLDCGDCHAEMFPVDLSSHTMDKIAQIDSCQACHVSRTFSID